MYPSSQKSYRSRMTPFEVNFPGIPFMMSFPESDATLNPSGEKHASVTTCVTTRTTTNRTYKDGKLVEEQTFTKENTDDSMGSQFKDDGKALSYNTGQQTTNQYKTLTQSKEDGLVTTGSQVQFRSGNEQFHTQVGEDAKTSANQYETRTQDDFRFCNEKIPANFAQLKLDDKDRKSDFKAIRGDRTPTNDMGCIHSSRTETISKEAPKKDTKASPAKQKKELEESALKAHNHYRAIHGMPPLKLSKDLCEMAQKWADHLASIKTLKHSPCKLDGVSVGENVAYKWTSDREILTGKNATDNWYDEIKAYDFNQSKMSSGTGHFTQVVWKGSKELGIGRGCAEDGSNYVVANYRPAGNMIGSFDQNVFRPKK